ncbi:hypothetical protein FRC04_001170 [Tulasnella sp. 424]|nr:hypothetical protein FRC04_001170 [Tulasnella sp. 424]
MVKLPPKKKQRFKKKHDSSQKPNGRRTIFSEAQKTPSEDKQKKPALDIPIFFGLYLGYKIWEKTKVWRPEEMHFVRGIPTIEETEAPYVPPRTLGEKIFEIVF